MRRLVILAVLVLVGLSGCIKLEMNLRVTSNDTVEGSMIIAVDKSFSGALDSGRMDVMSPQELPENVERSKWSNEEYTGYKLTYAGMSLKEFNDRNSDEKSKTTIVHKNDRYIFTMNMSSLNEELSASGSELGSVMAGSLAESLEIRVRITFPGRVVETNGKVSPNGRTVTWTPEVGPSMQDLRAVAADSRQPPWLAIGVGGGLALLVLGTVAGALMLRRPQATGGAAVPTAAPTDGYDHPFGQ